MRERPLRRVLFDDPALRSLPLPVRWTYLGIICMADVQGRLVADPALIAELIWPASAEVGPQEVANHLNALEEAGAIYTYLGRGQRGLFAPFELLPVIQIERFEVLWPPRNDIKGVELLPPISRAVDPEEAGIADEMPDPSAWWRARSPGLKSCHSRSEGTRGAAARHIRRAPDRDGPWPQLQLEDDELAVEVARLCELDVAAMRRRLAEWRDLVVWLRVRGVTAEEVAERAEGARQRAARAGMDHPTAPWLQMVWDALPRRLRRARASEEEGAEEERGGG